MYLYVHAYKSEGAIISGGCCACTHARVWQRERWSNEQQILLSAQEEA